MRRFFTLLCLVAASQSLLLAQYVSVTLKLDRTQIQVGETTTLRVYGQISPEYRATTDRIFSWYIDLLNSQGGVGPFDPSKLTKPTSDNLPTTSSKGTVIGPNILGIYDTLTLPSGNPGRDAPLELLSIPIKGLAPGKTTFQVAPGSSVPELFADFIVAPTGGGNPLIGGIYDDAQADLEVVSTILCTPSIRLQKTPLTPTSTRIIFAYDLCPGRTHTLEYQDILKSPTWVPVDGAPHNLGIVVVTNTAPRRFYRLRIN